MKNFLKVIVLISFFIPLSLFAQVKGIYLTQLTAQKTPTVEYLIKNAKEVGINTFVVDYDNPSKNLEKNLQLIKESGIRYVARVVIFPGGGTPDQIKSQAYLDKKLQLVKAALALGADEIQLDYIRYKPTQRPSDKNADDIAKVIQYFRDNIPSNIPLQIDVFGISSFKPSVYIGQNVGTFSKIVSAINPMVYPSHFEPFREHAKTPYKTIHDSLTYLKKQVDPSSNVKIHAYIELFNYRYPMNYSQRVNYILAEMKAVDDSDINGYYVWSAGNHYDILFDVLRNYQSKLADNNLSKDSTVAPSQKPAQATAPDTTATPAKAAAEPITTTAAAPAQTPVPVTTEAPAKAAEPVTTPAPAAAQSSDS